MVLGIDPDLVIPDKRLSVYEGAVAPWKGEKMGLWKENFIRAAKAFDFPVHKPIADLTKEQYDSLWKGNKYANGINDFFKEVEAEFIQGAIPGDAKPLSRKNYFVTNAMDTASQRSIVCKDWRVCILVNYARCL